MNEPRRVHSGHDWDSSCADPGQEEVGPATCPKRARRLPGPHSTLRQPKQERKTLRQVHSLPEGPLRQRRLVVRRPIQLGYRRVTPPRARPHGWRRGRDSNPGPGSTPGNRLAGGCLRPTRPPLRADPHVGGPSSLCQWRRGRDSNPRGREPVPVFKTGAFDRSATPPVSSFRAVVRVGSSSSDVAMRLEQEW